MPVVAAPAGQIEAAFRYNKPELALASPRLWFSRFGGYQIEHPSLTISGGSV